MKSIRVFIGVIIIISILSGCEDGKSKKEYESIINSILLKEHHPIYYGDLKDAKKFSEKFSEKTVVVNDKYLFDNKKTILSIGGYDNSIRDIEIYLDVANERVTEKEGFKIVKSYLPKNVLEKYYSEPVYKKYMPKDTSKLIYKTMCYSLTEEGRKHNEKEPKYQGEVTVIFEEDKKGIKNIIITFGEPRWMFSAEINGYTLEEWKINDI